MRKQWEKAFLVALANTGTVTSAAEAAGISRKQAYVSRELYPDFKKAWDDALEIAADTLEAEARKRAFNGDTTLIIFLLKAYRPERFRETRVSIPPVELNKMIEAEFKRLRAAESEMSEAVN